MTPAAVNRIGWVITEPLAAANHGYDAAHEPVPVPAEVWRTPLPVLPGDRVMLVWDDDEVLLTAPVRGRRTAGGLFASIERGMLTPIPASEARAVYRAIGRFVDGHRLRLAQDFERGALVPADLVGDARFFEGHLAPDRKTRVWSFHAGS